MGSQARLGTSKPSRNVNVIFSTKTKPYSLNPRYNFSVSSDTYRITESKVVLFFLFFQRVGQKIKNTGFAFFSFFIFFYILKALCFLSMDLTSKKSSRPGSYLKWLPKFQNGQKLHFLASNSARIKKFFWQKSFGAKSLRKQSGLSFFIFEKGVPKNPKYWFLAILANFWRH